MDCVRRALAESTLVLKIGCIVKFLAFVIFVIGFATPHWSKGGEGYVQGVGYVEINEGLWRRCLCTKGEGECTCGDIEDSARDLKDLCSCWLVSVQVLESLALVAVIVAVILTVAAFLTASFIVKIADLAISSVAAALKLIGIIVYGNKVEEGFQYSFVLVIVGMILLIVSAVFTVIDIFTTRRQRAEMEPGRVVYTQATQNKE